MQTSFILSVVNGYSNRQTGRTKDLPGIVRPQWYLDMDADSILIVVGVVEVVEVVVVVVV